MKPSVRITFLALIAALALGWVQLHRHTVTLEHETAGVRP